MTYYELLELEPTATTQEIKQAYRRLARLLHPDINPDPVAHSRFKQITTAYETLIDPQARQDYDQALAPVSPFIPTTAFHDLFNSIFSMSHIPGPDLEFKLDLDLDKLYNGFTTALSFPPSISNQTLPLDIPPGMTPNSRLYFPNLGAPSPSNGPAGDLYVSFNLDLPEHYALVDNDLYYELLISPWEAVLGHTLTHDLPNTTLTIVIPPASSSDDILTYPAHGLPANSTHSEGDFIVVLKIVTPPSVPPNIKNYFEKIAKSSDFDPRIENNPRS